MVEPEIITIDTIPAHLQQLFDNMQPELGETMYVSGVSSKKALWSAYRQSFICKSVFINGEIAAIFGISGVMFGQTARPWIAMASEADDYPMRVAFAYRRELKAMSGMFPILEDFVEENNEKAIRMLQLMGFQVENNVLMHGDVRMRRAVRMAS